MKITVTNDDAKLGLRMVRRAGGLRVEQTIVEPGQSATYTLERDDESVSFSRGQTAEAPKAANAAPNPKPPVEPKPVQPSWQEIRTKAIALGAPKTVSKADALKLIAEHEAKPAA